MHGLVATQSQSIFSSDDQPILEGSQKENTPASWDKNRASPTRISSPLSSPTRPPAEASNTVELKETTQNVPPPTKELPEKPCTKDLGNRTNGVVTPVKGPKAVSFISPSRSAPRPQGVIDRFSTVPARQMPPPPTRPRSPSPASQDSFAGPLPQPDPVKAFIAQAKNFTIPLSQLGEDSQSVSDEEGPPPVASSVWPRGPSSPRGKILVVGTPSNSSHDSQSQRQAKLSQPYQQADSQEGHGDAPDSFPQAQPRTLDMFEYLDQPTQEESAPTQEDDAIPHTRPSSPGASTEPTSSYQRLLGSSPYAAHPGDDTPPTQIVTQSTQPADETPPTQIASVDVSTIAREHDYYNENGQYEFPAIPSEARSNTASRLSDRRGLFALIPPEKRHRYMHIKPEPGPFIQDYSHVPTQETQLADAPGSPVEQTQALETIEHTQPSDVAVNGSAISTFPKRSLPPANIALQARGLRSTNPPTPQSPDARIVPDSEGAEPTQVVSSPPPSTRRRLPSASPLATPQREMKSRPRHLQSEDEVLQAVAEEVDAPAMHEEEEEEEEEEEVPLAAAVRSSRAKGKQKAAAAPSNPAISSPVAARGQGAKPPQSPSKNGINRDAIAVQRSRSWKDAVIPSSDPQERHEDAKAATSKKRSKKPKTPIPQPIRTRAPRAAKLAARGKLYESPTEDEDEEDEDADVPDNASDDHDTVPAEDEMDVDPPDVKPTHPPRNNKRKRTASSSSRKVPSRTIVKEESATPLRPAKRVKTASAAHSTGTHTPTRVYALHKSTARYSSGVVEEVIGTKYKIKFDGGDEAILELKHIRLCQLKPGDHVLYDVNCPQKATIVGVPECTNMGYDADDLVTIELDDEVSDVQVQNIMIASRTVTADWNDRSLAEHTIVPLVRPRNSRASPTPSRFSVPSEGSVRVGAKRLLAKTGLVVTSSPGNPEWSNQKDSLMASVKRLGGVFLDDWTNLYTMEGSLALKGQRWILTSADIQWRKVKDIDRLFLISDDHNQKPKFLIALALGIPCVSVNWLKAIVTEQQENKTWWSYLLPAGYSEQLGARVSQTIDLDWGNSIHHITEITDNLVPHKVFADLSILCISSDFVPYRQKGKKVRSDSEAAEMVPRIVLCMGAATVEAVSDRKFASRKLKDYDYVVVRDDADTSSFQDVNNCVNVSWVKDCLISGRLLAHSGQPRS
ncbi:hypothetical protein C8Q76DRAFT_813486 [Earliella scabrosa]|nr:hypothetical protein C8Q76DRAFT_813486 [Earliella scabrosa]